jgi:hypothetical protein
VNSPGWISVRKQAEDYRDLLFHFFNKDVLEDLLPHPDTPLRFKNKIIDASGIKTLLGFMLWLNRYK